MNMKRTMPAGVLGVAMVGGIAAFAKEFFSRCAEIDQWQQERDSWQRLSVPTRDVTESDDTVRSVDRSDDPNKHHSRASLATRPRFHAALHL